MDDPPDPREVERLERLVATSLLESSPRARSGSGEFTASLRLDGRVVAGIYGAVFGKTCELQHLFVDPEQRRRGLGRRVVEAAEREASRRGCRQVVLFTHASQGERFYPQLGYELLARVEDYPDGDAALWFRKPVA